MSRGFLPRQDVQFTNQTGRPTSAFYTWLQGLDAAIKGGASVEEIRQEIQRLRQDIADLPTSGFLPDTANVQGVGSIDSSGTLGGGIVQMQLEGDQATPPASHYYGTDQAGVRGFFERLLATLADVDADSPSVGDGLVWNGSAWSAQTVASTGGFLPLTTGEIAGDQPVFVYGPDGRLIYAPVT